MSSLPDKIFSAGKRLTILFWWCNTIVLIKGILSARQCVMIMRLTKLKTVTTNIDQFYQTVIFIHYIY